MKKTLAIVLCLLMLSATIATAATPEIDLASLTYDDLQNLKKTIDAELSSRPEAASISFEAGSGLEYDEGMYKVGSDLPAGIYFAIEKPKAILPNIAIKDGAGSSAKTLEYILITNHSIIGVKEGQYVTIKGATLIDIADSKVYVQELTANAIPQGMYQVGFHIPAGEYKVIPDEKATLPNIAIYSDAYMEETLDYTLVKGPGYVELKDGEIVKLSGVSLQK